MRFYALVRAAGRSSCSTRTAGTRQNQVQLGRSRRGSRRTARTETPIGTTKEASARGRRPRGRCGWHFRLRVPVVIDARHRFLYPHCYFSEEPCTSRSSEKLVTLCVQAVTSQTDKSNMWGEDVKSNLVAAKLQLQEEEHGSTSSQLPLTPEGQYNTSRSFGCAWKAATAKETTDLDMSTLIPILDGCTRIVGQILMTSSLTTAGLAAATQRASGFRKQFPRRRLDLGALWLKVIQAQENTDTPAPATAAIPSP
jgi:hypothetical protein